MDTAYRMKLYKLILLFTILPLSFCFAMEEASRKIKNSNKTMNEYINMMSQKNLQLQEAFQHGGKAAILELKLTLLEGSKLAFTPKAKKALLKSQIIDTQGTIVDAEYLRHILSDETLAAEIMGISRK